MPLTLTFQAASFEKHMADIFFSHVEEDFGLIEEMARGLEAAGYSTWFYERDALPGKPHRLQTRAAIAGAEAIVLVVSTSSFDAHQVSQEVSYGADSGKRFVPVLWGVTHVEFRSRMPEWESAVAGAVALRVPEEGIASVLPKLVAGLREMGIEPSERPDPVEERLAEIAQRTHVHARSDAVEDVLRKLAEDFPDSARAHHALGQFYNRTFRHADAAMAFETAVGLEPGNAVLSWDLALTYQKLGRAADAAASLQRATALGLDAGRQRQALALLKALQEGVA